jgi:hypothetical protein
VNAIIISVVGISSVVVAARDDEDYDSEQLIFDRLDGTNEKFNRMKNLQSTKEKKDKKQYGSRVRIKLLLLYNIVG